MDPQADDDGDGWTNAQEAAAGTDPFDPNPPDGFLRPDVTHTPAVIGEENGQPYIITPEAVTLGWTARPGKQYTLLFSADLSAQSWITVDAPFVGNGNIVEYHFETSAADNCFWRVAVADTDGDTLTDSEEATLGTNPALADTDGDGVADGVELAQGTSATDSAKFPPTWRRAERTLAYDFDLQATNGNLALTVLWDAALNTNEQLSSPIAFTALKDRLANIAFPSAPPNGSLTELAPGAGNAVFSENDYTSTATMNHQRVWLARSPATQYGLQKKVVLFTSRTLNGTPQPPVFEPQTFTLPAFQSVSNAIDLVEGFTSDGLGSGSNPPPDPGNAATPGGHAESFIKQLVPVLIEDDHFATGVDNVFITADPSDIGHQEKFWIMAPAGNDSSGAPLTNAMKFNIPFAPAVEMEIVPPLAPAPTAAPDPTTLTLGADAPCKWSGSGTDTADIDIVWKLGLGGTPAGPKQEVALPIAVKVMKRRTVKVAVHEVISVVPGRADDAPDLLPRNPADPNDAAFTKSAIEDELNQVFERQLNARFEVTMFRELVAFDLADGNSFPGFTVTSPPVPGNRVLDMKNWSTSEPALVTAARPGGFDIQVYVLGGATSIQKYETNGASLAPGALYLYGLGNLDGSSICIVDGDLDGIYADGTALVPPERKNSSTVLHTIAHEIGHIMCKGGHPDTPVDPGVAPLCGTDPKRRLMCQVGSSQGDSRLLVKTEWDEADKWLIIRPNGDN